MTEHFEDSAAAYLGPFEPRTPCRQFATRACTDLIEEPPTVLLRVTECPPGGCSRFPGRDGSARH